MFEPNPDMVVWPLAWKLLTPSNRIRLLGVTEEEEHICVIIDTGVSYVLNFNKPVDAAAQEYIKGKFSALSLTPSNMNSHIITMRVNHLLDEDHLKDAVDLESFIVDDDWCNAFFRARNIAPYKPITISNFAPAPVNFSNCDITINTYESSVLPSDSKESVERDSIYVEVEKKGDAIEQIISRVFGKNENVIFTTNREIKGPSVQYAKDETVLINEFIAWCSLQTQNYLSLGLIATNYGLTALQEKCKNNRLWQTMLRDYNIELFDATKMTKRMLITDIEAHEIDTFDLKQLENLCIPLVLFYRAVYVCNMNKLSFETITNTTDEELIDNFARSIDSAVRFIPNTVSKHPTCGNGDSQCECFNIKHYQQYIAARLSEILYFFACHLGHTALNSKYFGPDS